MVFSGCEQNYFKIISYHQTRMLTVDVMGTGWCEFRKHLLMIEPFFNDIKTVLSCQTQKIITCLLNRSCKRVFLTYLRMKKWHYLYFSVFGIFPSQFRQFSREFPWCMVSLVSYIPEIKVYLCELRPGGNYMEAAILVWNPE